MAIIRGFTWSQSEVRMWRLQIARTIYALIKPCSQNKTHSRLERHRWCMVSKVIDSGKKSILSVPPRHRPTSVSRLGNSFPSRLLASHHLYITSTHILSPKPTVHTTLFNQVSFEQAIKQRNQKKKWPRPSGPSGRQPSQCGAQPSSPIGFSPPRRDTHPPKPSPCRPRAN